MNLRAANGWFWPEGDGHCSWAIISRTDPKRTDRTRAYMHALLLRLALIAALLPLGVSCSNQLAADVLPSRFENNRIFLVPVTTEGRVVGFATDTGGGWNAIKRSTVEELGLADALVDDSIPFPEFRSDRAIPSNPLFNNGRLLVVDDSELGVGRDGFLGGRWFGDKVWEFDYLREQLSVHAGADSWEGRRISEVELGFQVDQHGKRTMHFPRMSIEVDGNILEVLLDTGAKAQLSDRAAAHFGEEQGTSVGTSFIVQSVFEEWVDEHPEWTVLPAADTIRGHSYPMIEVPEVVIGEHTVGPIWFTVRPDSAFLEYMSSMMDQTVHGALGGSGLQYFRLVVDYPNAKAYFFVN